MFLNPSKTSSDSLKKGMNSNEKDEWSLPVGLTGQNLTKPVRPTGKSPIPKLMSMKLQMMPNWRVPLHCDHRWFLQRKIRLNISWQLQNYHCNHRDSLHNSMKAWLLAQITIHLANISPAMLRETPRWLSHMSVTFVLVKRNDQISASLKSCGTSFVHSCWKRYISTMLIYFCGIPSPPGALPLKSWFIASAVSSNVKYVGITWCIVPWSLDF